jgi:hypothetical protein
MCNLPSSTQKGVVERYWREDDRLRVDMVTEDAVFLLEPIKFGFEWRKTETPLLLPYRCDPGVASCACDRSRQERLVKMTFQPGETVIASGHASKAPGRMEWRSVLARAATGVR